MLFIVSIQGAKVFQTFIFSVYSIIQFKLRNMDKGHEIRVLCLLDIVD